MACAGSACKNRQSRIERGAVIEVFNQALVIAEHNGWLLGEHFSEWAVPSTCADQQQAREHQAPLKYPCLRVAGPVQAELVAPDLIAASA